MSVLKKFAISVGAAGAMLGMTAASAAIVGGIDFGNLGNNHIETSTLAQTFVNGVGQVSTAYGLVSTVNGDSTYCADGTANCSLYYMATNRVSFVNGNDLYFDSTAVTIYYSALPAANLLTQDSAANLAFISGLSTWATLNGENGVDPTAAGLVSDTAGTQVLTGTSISVLGSGLLSMDIADGLGLAAVEAFWDTNTIGTFTGAFADTLGLERFSLVVHDWGGAGLAWAAANPERIEKLVVIDAVPLLAGYRWHRTARLWRTRGVGEVVVGAMTGFALRRALPRGVGSVAAEHFDQGTQRAILRLYRSAPPEALAAHEERLAALKDVPTLVVWGKEDPYIAPKYAKRYADALGGATVRVLSGAGHWPWIDDAVLYGEVVSFLR